MYRIFDGCLELAGAQPANLLLRAHDEEGAGDTPRLSAPSPPIEYLVPMRLKQGLKFRGELYAQACGPVVVGGVGPALRKPLEGSIAPRLTHQSTAWMSTRERAAR